MFLHYGEDVGKVEGRSWLFEKAIKPKKRVVFSESLSRRSYFEKKRTILKDNWNHIKTFFDGEPFEIEGLNIWEYEWINTGNYIQLNDPLHNQPYSFPIYEMSNGKVKVVFAAGEFSNCVYGIYQKGR